MSKTNSVSAGNPIPRRKYHSQLQHGDTSKNPKEGFLSIRQQGNPNQSFPGSYRPLPM